MKRGRPASINVTDLNNILLEYKDQIIDKDTGSILTKQNPLWEEISRVVFGKTKVVKAASSLYTHVCCRKPFTCQKIVENADNSNHFEVTTDSDPNISTASEKGVIVKIHFSKKEFSELTELKVYNQNHPKRAKTRAYKIFIPGKWQLAITKRLWEEHRIKCGFLYGRGRLYENSGSISGHCNCSSTIDCVITDLQREVIEITCSIAKSSEFLKCNKRPCRNPERMDIGKRMVQAGKSGSVVEKERANELMLFGDNIPPHLYDQKVLRDAKSEYATGLHVHRDPFTALCALKSNALKNSIHDIGANPFYLYYSSVQQLQIYMEYFRANPDCAKIVVDASGRLIRPIVRPDGTISGHIFLYDIVIYWDTDQVAIFHMLSEKHDALHIANWFRFWNNLGAPPPKEFVSDDGKAILIAAINVFTRYRTITEYVNACFLKKQIACYVRIDVAHFVKNYTKLLKDIQPLVKRFLMVAVGQLILVKSLEEATQILKSILVVCRATSGGRIFNDLTECTRSIEFIKKRATQHEDLEREIENIFTDLETNVRNEGYPSNTSDEHNPAENNECDEDTEYQTPNLYLTWAKEIDKEACAIVATEKGDEPNPYYFPPLAQKLLRDCKQIPMWSCVSRNHFGYGREPATSASVESDFNNLKTRLINKKVGMRADKFVQIHLEHTSGTAKIMAGQRKIRTTGDADAVIGQGFDQDIVEPVLDETLTTDCPECQIGNMPGGAHKCAICYKPVHIIWDSCSVACPGEEEGFGQRRICVNCNTIRNSHEIEAAISAHETEKWGGLENKEDSNRTEKRKNEKQKKQTKTSYYLRTDFSGSDFTATGKIQERKILKNANSLDAKVYKIHNEKYSLRNTCAFDAISQLLLSIIRKPTLRETVKSWDTAFSQFIIDIFNKGILCNTYAKRAFILLNEMPKINVRKVGNVSILQCEVNAGELTSKLLEKHQLICQTAVCNKCAKKRTLPLSCLSVETSAIKMLNEQIKKICSSKTEPCGGTCSGTITEHTAVSGPFLFVAVYDCQGIVKRVKLSEIPKEVMLPDENEVLRLEGFVSFKLCKATRNSRLSRSDVSQDEEDLLAASADVHHYTAVILQNNGQWTEVDDLLVAENSLKDKSVLPHVLVYCKEK